MKTQHVLQYVDMRQRADQQVNDNNNQVSSALIVNGYCLALTEQPKFDFSADPHLISLQKDLNDSLADAVNHANDYIDHVQNQCLVTLNNLLDIFNRTDQTISLYPKFIAREDVIESINSIHKKCGVYQTQSESYKKQCDDFRENITNSSSDFSGINKRVQAAVEGDGGEITDLNNKVAEIDKKINELTAASVLSAVGILGGAVLICVGAATEVFTGGAATAAIVVGVGVVGTGISGEAASTISLVDCYKQKNKLLAEIYSLKQESSQATAVNGQLLSLVQHANDAATALVDISKQWTDLASSLKILNQNLNDADSDDNFTEHLIAYKSANQPIEDSAKLLKSQYMQVQPTTDKTTSVSDQLQQATKASAA
ncbi:alpha-helical pore-forming toxin family protein [Pectobacterium aroidearum]|uniref:HBL/NHE enterotoxin family protein n=1 Tax=Pectobacterium aroidearum TaxID=1201031 RepID=UPI0015F0F08E|nr:HBL/NHE enterotoxin family protein [Pectobacterium aroidearum]MBA5235539.1 HBL/NHE enterotoxin family protein [Pectobacterium aroidearum]UUE34472.1 alpha-helical pore-forming toxin family protein [Pectobacterium aroidearum]UUE38850.1 alpha-helical pore-forming toxin family protein [Pectobacterium aroidearum]